MASPLPHLSSLVTCFKICLKKGEYFFMKIKYNIIFLIIIVSLFFNSCANTLSQDNSRLKSLTKASTTGISREIVKGVIDEHLNEIQKCYENTLTNGIPENKQIINDLKGRIVYEWSINKVGEVENVSMLSSTISHTDLEICVEPVIKTWKFPEPKKEKVIVTYPFDFDLKKI